MQEPTSSRLGVLLVAMACLLLPACTDAEPAGQPPSVPDRATIAAAIAGHAEVINDFNQVRAIVVATDDQIVFEQYYGTDQDEHWGVRSITKSVISTLIGIALEEGLIGSLDDNLEHLLPHYADAMSPAVAGTTLKQLLTMTAGFPSEAGTAPQEFTLSEDWVQNILLNPESPPGEDFRYSDDTSHLLAAVLEEATGTSALDFARSWLFDPLGIDTRPAYRPAAVPRRKPSAGVIEAYENAGFAWPVDPQGVSTGWWGLKLRPRDMVKLGQLFLQDGHWGDRQVVPADWVAQATTPQVPADGHGDGYGFQWWTATVKGDDAYRAVGHGGQLIEVIPDRNLVVVTATEVRDDDPTSRGIDPNLLLSIIEDAIVSQFPTE